MLGSLSRGLAGALLDSDATVFDTEFRSWDESRESEVFSYSPEVSLEELSDSNICVKRNMLIPPSLTAWLVSNLIHLCEFLRVFLSHLHSRPAWNLVGRSFG